MQLLVHDLQLSIDFEQREQIGEPVAAPAVNSNISISASDVGAFFQKSFSDIEANSTGSVRD